MWGICCQLMAAKYYHQADSQFYKDGPLEKMLQKVLDKKDIRGNISKFILTKPR